MSKTLELMDAASAIVSMSAVTGLDIPIADVWETEGAIEDHLLSLFHVSRRLSAEQKLIQRRLDHLRNQQDRVRQSAIGLVFSYREVTGRDDVVSSALRAAVKSGKDGICRISWSER